MPSVVIDGKRYIQTVHSIRCKLCNETIQSTWHHDFKMCSCNTVGVDGGIQCGNRILGEWNNYEDLSRWRTETKPYEWVTGETVKEHFMKLNKLIKTDPA